MTYPLLSVQRLNVAFKQRGRWLCVADDLNFDIHRHEVLAVIGESGCGKSVSAMAIGRLLSEANARVTGTAVLSLPDQSKCDCLTLSEREMRKIRGRHIAYIFQEPSICLNPVIRVGDQLREVFDIHFPEMSCTDETLELLLREVGIPEPAKRLRCYPHELSGGMQQRVMIAMALAAHPDLLVADEPTTALDVTVQAQVLRLMSSICRKYKMSVMLITHNFGLVGELADRVMVMYAGQIVEEGSAQAIVQSPMHPYTRALIQAVPVLGVDRIGLNTIPGRVPLPGDYPVGCRFYDRCLFRTGLTDCEQAACLEPQLLHDFESGRCVRCIHGSNSV